jgi:hypothetical protein
LFLTKFLPALACQRGIFDEFLLFWLDWRQKLTHSGASFWDEWIFY